MLLQNFWCENSLYIRGGCHAVVYSLLAHLACIPHWLVIQIVAQAKHAKVWHQLAHGFGLLHMRYMSVSAIVWCVIWTHVKVMLCTTKTRLFYCSLCTGKLAHAVGGLLAWKCPGYSRRPSHSGTLTIGSPCLYSVLVCDQIFCSGQTCKSMAIIGSPFWCLGCVTRVAFHAVMPRKLWHIYLHACHVEPCA
jgi:hypothetical protein